MAAIATSVALSHVSQEQGGRVDPHYLLLLSVCVRACVCVCVCGVIEEKGREMGERKEYQ